MIRGENVCTLQAPRHGVKLKTFVCLCSNMWAQINLRRLMRISALHDMQ